MARDADSIEAKEQRLAEQLDWARKHGSEKTIADAQRRYDDFLRKHNPREW